MYDSTSNINCTCCLSFVVAEEGLPPETCYNIGYFGQSSDRFDEADTTNSILRESTQFTNIINIKSALYFHERFVLISSYSLSLALPIPPLSHPWQRGGSIDY